MVVTGPAEVDHDRKSELEAFDDTKGGVKGLVDAGVTKVPRIFIQPPEIIAEISNGRNCRGVSIPVIDLNGIGKDPIQRKEIVEQVRDSSEKWGFFQVINHCIPIGVLEEMMNGTRRFYEQDFEVKKEWYTRDRSRAAVYNSNFDLYSTVAANWRDTLYCVMGPDSPKPQQFPEACRYFIRF